MKTYVPFTVDLLILCHIALSLYTDRNFSFLLDHLKVSCGCTVVHVCQPRGLRSLRQEDLEFGVSLDNTARTHLE
jgi:hypothetical protein